MLRSGGTWSRVVHYVRVLVVTKKMQGPVGGGLLELTVPFFLVSSKTGVRERMVRPFLCYAAMFFFQKVLIKTLQ